MNEDHRTREDLIAELGRLRDRIAILERSDVSAEQRQVELAFTESEERFRDVVENINEVFWMAKADLSKMLYVSPSYERVWGRSCASLYDDPQSWMDQVHPLDRERVRTLISQREDRGHTLEYRIIRPDGTVRWIRDCGFPVQKRGGQNDRVTGIAEDITERKEAEEQLRQSEERFRTLADAALEGIAVTEHGRVVDANEQLLQIIGGTRPEVIGQEVASFVAPEDRDRVMASIIGGLVSHTEHRMFRRDGTPIIVETHGRTTTYQGRQVRITAIRDITERTRMEEALRSSEARYRSLYENSLDAVLLTQPDGRVLSANPQACRLFGMTEEEIIRAGRAGLVVEDEHFAAAFTERERTGRARAELTHRRKDGTTFLGEVSSGLFLDTDGTVKTSMVIRDITERKRADEALRQARDELEERVKQRTTELARQANLLDLTLDAVLVRDWEDRITFWNRGAKDLYGWTTEDAVGKSPHDLLKTKFPDGLVAVNRALSTRGSWEGELEHTAKDGRVLTVSSRMVRWDEDGLPAGTLEVNRDVTERRQVEAQLRQAQKMEAIGTLAGGVAHDFNNILAAIIGFTEMVLDDVTDNPHIQQKMERVLTAGLRGRDLIKQILAFSRKTDGKQREIGLTPLVAETHALLRASLPSTIQMHLINATSDDHVVADPTQLQQVLMNLATNAADAMREDGGQLTIGLSSVTFPPDGALPDHDMEPGTYVKLTVQDTGTGMTEEVRQRIFEPFFTTKEPGRGTGMGLAVVYGVVKSLGGAVTVRSEAGQGSTFEVFLPQAQRPEPRKEETVTSPLPVGTERVLFVDDEEMLVEMARDMLGSLGYQVTVAENGREAWNLFLEDPSRFDIVITDQTMPDMTGVTLAQQMLRARKDLPIVLCTGYSELVSAEKAEEVGIRAFVMKPIVRRELTETVRRVLDQKG